MKRIPSLVGATSLLCACATEQLRPEQSSAPANVVLDEDLIKLGRLVPGFGGLYIDANGHLIAYMVGDAFPVDAGAVQSRQAQLEKALLEVYGANVLSQGLKSGDPGRPPGSSPPPKINIVKGNHDILHLAEWRKQADRVLGLPGVVFTDLDERSNRVKIGVGPGAARDRIEAAIKESGVPRDAVIIEDTRPIYEQSTLRSHVRPLPGGVQIEADIGAFSFKTCTIGFNAIRAGVGGFVTNSHCTATRGGSSGTDFHQPDDPWWTEGNKVGDEIADPGYFTGGSCPSDRRCRFSDSAFIDYSIARGSNIARTTGRNNGSLTISSSNPRLTIVGVTSSWIDGSELDKVGRTTGWTFGAVNGTCQNINVSDADVTLFCQHRVRRISGTHRMTNNGDSGSPVFQWQGNTVVLSGILWGGPDDGSSFLFSPMNQIEQELGTLTTFNFPGPMPGGCPAGHKCCETELVGANLVCVKCVPNNAQCQ